MKKKIMDSLFIQAMKQSFNVTKNISPHLIRFDIFKNIWYSVMPLINNGVLPSLGIIMITKLNKQEDMIMWMVTFIGATAIFGVVSSTLMELENYYDTLREEKNFQEQKAFMAMKIDTLDPAQLFTGKFSELKTKFETRGWRSMAGMYKKFFMIIQTVIALTLSIGVAVVLSPWVVVFAVIPGIFSGISIALTDKKGSMIWDEGHHNRMMHSEYDKLVSSNRSVLQTIFHGSREYFKFRFIETRNGMNDNLLQIQTLQTKRRFLFIGINLICTIGAIIVICIPAMKGKMTVAMWPMAYAGYVGIRSSIGQFSFTIAKLISSFDEYKKYFAPLVDLQPLYPEGSKKVQTILPVQLDNVVFTYPNETKPTIKGISLTINKGEMIGLVGENGGGKTTLINMISSVYYPNSGSLTLGNVPVQDIKRSSIYSYLLVESTNNGLPNTTIREIVSASIVQENDDQTWESLEAVGMKKFVENLPKQLDTEIGERWKKSKLLSTGQMKRLSLASLHFKSKNPNIELIILDEPMGNIDPRVKREMYKKITNGELFPGKTVITCLHDEHFESLFPRLIRIENGMEVIKDKIFIPGVSLSFSLYDS